MKQPTLLDLFPASCGRPARAGSWLRSCLGMGCVLACACSTAFGAVATWVVTPNSDWHNPLNWFGGSLPGPDDDVVIGSSTEVRVYAAATVRSISAAPGVHLVVVGAAASLLVTGPTQIDGTSLRVYEGGRLSLPGLRSYSAATWDDRAYWYVSDPGSELSIPALTTLVPASFPWQMEIAGVRGGRLTVDGTFEVTTGELSIMAADAATVVELPGLRRLAPRDLDLAARDGGRVSLPNLLVYSGAQAWRQNANWSVYGTNSVLEVSGLTSFEGGAFPWWSWLSVGGGGRMALAGQFAVTGGGVFLEVSGSQSTFTAPGWERMAADHFSSDISAGAQVVFSNLKEWDGSASVRETSYCRSRGAGTRLSLPALTNVVGAPFPFFAQFSSDEGGRLELGGQFSLVEGGVVLAATGVGAVLEAPGLESLSPSAVYVNAENGGRVSMPHLREFSAAGIAWSGSSWRSGGTNSLIECSELTNFRGSKPPWVTSLDALGGGGISLSGAFEVTAGGLHLRAQGAGSWIETPGLTRALPEYFDLTAAEGGRITMPALREYSGVNALASVYCSAIGVDSVLDLPALTHGLLPGGPWGLYITARDGGHALFPTLAQLTPGSLNLAAEGSGAVLDARALSRFEMSARGGSILAADGGEVLLPPVFTLRNAWIQGVTAWGLPAVTNNFSPADILFATPGLSVLLETRPARDPGVPWQRLGRVAVTTNQLALRPLFLVPAGAELRSSAFSADPPELEMHQRPDGSTQLTVFGLTGSTYRLSTSPGVTPAVWTPGGAVTLTHPFEQIEWPAPGDQGFVRVMKEP